MKIDVGPLLRLITFRATGDMGPYTFYTRQGKKTIFYLKAPPHKPLTFWQIHQRDRWVMIAEEWRALPQVARQAWSDLCRICHIRITPYNLFVHARSRPGDLTVETLLANSGFTWQDLLPMSAGD